jgi:hypothetical protein
MRLLHQGQVNTMAAETVSADAPILFIAPMHETGRYSTTNAAHGHYRVLIAKN